MTERQFCADKLLLVREMLQAARQYLQEARESCEDGDRTMLRLAYDHLLDLRDAVRVLERKVNDLEVHLRVKLGGTPPGAARKSKGARAGIPVESRN